MTKKLPYWSEKTLQGLAYWIGYRNCYYFDHPLTEGAIIAETCSLIYSHLSENERLLAEIMYKNLINDKSNDLTTNHTRADLVIINTRKYKRKENISNIVNCIIEVKRAEAGKKLIIEDIKRLHNALNYNDNLDVRAFLIVVSQSRINLPIANSSGCANRKFSEITQGIPCNIIRLCKATSSFNKDNIKRAKYACIIEVYKTKKGELK